MIAASTDAAALRIFETGILRKIQYELAIHFCIRCKSELYEFLNDRDVVQCINIQRLLWLIHLVCMEENAPASRVYDASICGIRRRGLPCIRWKDQIEKALTSIGVSNWHRSARKTKEIFN